MPSLLSIPISHLAVSLLNSKPKSPPLALVNSVYVPPAVTPSEARLPFTTSLLDGDVSPIPTLPPLKYETPPVFNIIVSAEEAFFIICLASFAACVVNTNVSCEAVLTLNCTGPLTSSFLFGLSVPIPTLPVSERTNCATFEAVALDAALNSILPEGEYHMPVG